MKVEQKKIETKHQYRQQYREAWEELPEFKGWLKGVKGKKSRATCIYCKKILHAHRLSLLKHTCTLKHQKATELNFQQLSTVEYNEVQETTIENYEKQNNKLTKPIQNFKLSSGNSSKILDLEQNKITTDEINQGIDDIYEEYEIKQISNESEDTEEMFLDNSEHDIEQAKVQKNKFIVEYEEIIQHKSNMSEKPPISTHILDTSIGRPASNVQISLYKLMENRWIFISEGFTNTDGRFHNFLEKSTFQSGRYKLHFAVGKYFEDRSVKTIYPFVEIAFDCESDEEHYHIPLLLNPFGYSTYRGS